MDINYPETEKKFFASLRSGKITMNQYTTLVLKLSTAENSEYDEIYKEYQQMLKDNKGNK